MLNKVQLIGNLGRDPETRYTQSGKAVGQFSVAVDGGSRDKTEWVNVKVWEKNAENCQQYLKKGSRAYVEGRLETESWDGNDGQKKYKTVVVASRVIFLDRKDAGEGQGKPQGRQDGYEEVPFSDEDLPF